MGLLTVGVGVSLTLLPAFGTLFLLLGCFIQPYFEGRGLVPLHPDKHVWCVSPGGLPFFEGVDLGYRTGGREGLGGEGGETMTRI